MRHAGSNDPESENAKLTRTYDWLNPDPNAMVRPKDPREYSKKLRFHNKVRHAREYGL